MKKKLLGLLLAVLLVGFATGCTPTNDEADFSNYPERMIEVYVGHGAGGGTDSFVRTITGIMAEDLGVRFNIINQPGASGSIAMKTAMTKDSDGYTIIGDSAYAVTTAGDVNEYGLDKVIPIARIQSDIYALQVKNGRFSSIDEMIEFAKANPGEVKLGAVGSGGMDEITARRFMEAAGVEMSYIPMEGAGAMHSNILGGHIDVMLEEVGPVVSYVDSGEIVPLLFFSQERLEAFPEVPTTVENGWDLTTGIERYLMISADAPKEVIEILEAAAKRAMETEEYQAYAEKAYLNLRSGWMGSDDFTAKLESDIEVYKQILADLNN